MSDLPDVVQEAGLLLQRPSVQRDPKAMKQIRAWGHAQIDASFPEDPIKAPLNVIRRGLARREWDKVVRTAGRDLRGAIANSLVRELEFDIERRQTDIMARDAEDRRQEAITFDTRTRIQAHELTRRIDLQYEKDLMDHRHQLDQQAQAIDFQRQTQLGHLTHALNQHAEDNASGRRINENISAVHQDIIKLTSQVLLETMGTTAGQEVLELVGKVSNEVTRIRSDNTLSDDDKHLQVKTLLDNLPAMLRRAKEP